MSLKKKLNIIFLLFISIYSAEAQVEKLRSVNLGIIPKPQNIVNVGELLSWDPKINVAFEKELSDQAECLIIFLKERGIQVSSKARKTLFLSKKKIKQNNESYEIKINEDSVWIHGNSIAGVSRGIATFQQLLLLNRKDEKISLPVTKIIDEPKFSHRGLLLDCARHYFDKKTVLKYIDLLAFYKMNTLHWHLTEDQGWRIEIDKYPKLNSIASSRIKPNGDIYKGIYTKEDIREIVEYALKKNITIIPEIELPGHSQAVIAAYPALSCNKEKIPVANDWGVFKEIYCAGNEDVFMFLEDVFTEVIELFPSKYIHIGGDEVPKIRWENCQKCQKRIHENGLLDEHQLQNYFIKRIQKFLNSKGREIIGWDEIIEDGEISGALIQSWRGVEHAIKGLEAGNSVIMSPTSHSYLDYDLKSIDLKKIYLFDPIPSESKSRFHDQILGGECNIWTEHVPNVKVLDNKVFPRMIGMAEALWSHGMKNFEEFNFRLQPHYEILESLDVKYGESMIPISYNTVFIKNQLFLQLFSKEKNINIKYKKGESGLMNYNHPILIKNNSIINVQAYKNSKPYGDIIKIPLTVHDGLFKDVEYSCDFNKFYPANKEIALVDGKIGSLDFRDGNWQGFFGKNIEVIIDLGHPSEDFYELVMNCYQYVNSWIFIPKSISVETSMDKKLWVKNNFIKFFPKNNEKNRNRRIQEIKINPVKKFKAQYLKIIIENYGKVPQWHEAAGSDSWTFLDEVQVNFKGRK